MEVLLKINKKIKNIILYKKLNNLTDNEIKKINIIVNFIIYILFNESTLNYCNKPTYDSEYKDYQNYINAIELYENKTEEIENFKQDLTLEIIEHIIFNKILTIYTQKIENSVLDKLLKENNCTFLKIIFPDIKITIKEDTIYFEQNNISNKVKISFKIINETLKKVKEENICYTNTPVYENNYFNNIDFKKNNYIKKLLKK